MRKKSGMRAFEYESDEYVPTGERKQGAFGVGFRRKKGGFGVRSKKLGLFCVNFPFGVNLVKFE